ncbi:MAG: bacillithiol system redox-active protein YtxJ [Candidatus Eisenbacteria bacterium]|uniref:Bacillithiol system redox-active protein YtxJ n=1 Tax=Eiseniibacteriota bacterium TaxID=2212470 RepID=A0A956SFY6_UNCEI|nr:bacillithiol system redox-active protein YtxJ [Candidatus Eisenbacteria bacterium]MCB9464565.1 bacillithiol system redox-active protein YtxJ [Candidatus Eisenbacteria bacterium]
MNAPQLLSEADIEEAIAQPVFLLFKHSFRCGTSAEAALQFDRFVGASDTPVGWVDVVEQRPLARWIAERVGVVHQSPQVILFRDGKPVWNASHNAVTYDKLMEATGATPKA